MLITSWFAVLIKYLLILQARLVNPKHPLTTFLNFKKNLTMRLQRTLHHPDGGRSLAEYEIRDNNVYTTIHHTKGSGVMPWYEIRENKLYPTEHHPHGRSSFHWFEINGNNVLPSVHHPNGSDGLAWYKII